MANSMSSLMDVRRPFGDVAAEVRMRFADLKPYDRISRPERFAFGIEQDTSNGKPVVRSRFLRPLEDALQDAVNVRAGHAPDLSGQMQLTPLAYDQLAEKVLGAKIIGDFIARQPVPLQLAEWTWGLQNRVGNGDRRPLQFRMVKDTLCRAVLSDGYVPFDDVNIVDALAEAFDAESAFAHAEVVMTELDPLEQRSEFRIVFPRATGVLRVGDVVQKGIIIRNTATSGVAVWMIPYMERLVCSNGLRGTPEVDGAFRMPHLTAAAKMRQFLLDALHGLSGKWDAITAAYKAAMDKHIESPTGFFGKMESAFKGALTSDDMKGILDSFMADMGDGTLFDASMAVSRYAQTKRGDERLEMERIGGAMLALEVKDN